MCIRSLLVIFLLVPLSACSWFHRTRDCSGDNCYSPHLLETAKPPHKWYCYGEESGNWNCRSKADQALVKAVKPKPQAPVSPDQVPGAGTPIATTQTTVVQPLLNITNSILDQSDDSYVVQLTASHSEKDLAQYAAKHQVTNPLYIVVPGDNGPTYILLLGIYRDQDKAIDARELWERTRTLNEEPWVRNVAPLKKAIQAKETNE